MDETLKQISGILAKGTVSEREENAPFCVQRELLSSDIVVGVENVGVLSCPANEQEVKKIIDVSFKSQFGLRDQTLLDENVRDSYEVKADKLQVTLNENFLKMLSEMSEVLGLPKNAELKPHLHNMLIYGPGQFFSKHQDTEKLKGMIATLVIVLPSPHIGGDLIVEHKGVKQIFCSENINSTMNKCMVFYSDCEHEIIKIKQGYRIALTYNLVLPSGHIASGEVNLKLKTAVDAHFTMAKFDKRNSDLTRRYLVYFLNYSYTEHSLRWDMLKGTDRKNASELLNVAKELDLIPNLALVEIHESYSTDDGPRYKYSRYDMSDGSSDDEDHVLGDLIDDDTTLSHWIGPSNEVLLLEKVNISNDNICYTKDTKEFEPDSKEYEGYTGNAGCTMDYWYRRAAVVLVEASLENRFLVNFSHNYEVAIQEFFDLVKHPSEEMQALKIIENAKRHLYRNYSVDDENDFKTFAKLALSIESRNVAQKLLSYFTWNILNFNVTEILFKLQNRYDALFLSALLTSWKDQNAKKRDDDIGHVTVLKNFYTIVTSLLAGGIDVTVIQTMIEIEKAAVIEDFRMPAQYRYFRYVSASEKMNRLKQILQVCILVPSETLQIQIVNFIAEHSTSYSIHDLVSLFFELRKNTLSYQAPYYKPMKDYLVTKIIEQRALHIRSNDDWSINVKLPCSCEYCNVAKHFLESKTDSKLVWSVVMKHRKHVYWMLMKLNLPITMSVERSGSPHKQIIIKNDLYKTDKAQFDKFTSYLNDLQTEPCNPEVN